MSADYAKKLGSLSKKYLSFETDKKITWCGNCGNYAIQNALMRALTLEGYKRNDFVLVFDVGCNGNGSDKMEANTIHGLHGRAISLAAGAAVANPNMKVIASAGDGATFSEGVNHLVHAVRNDFPVLFLFHNNENYGLTTGQASALTPMGARMNASPDGVYTPPINPLQFVLSLDPSWVARAYSGEVDHMTEMMRAGLKQKGFAFLEILQACPTYNRSTPDHWYADKVRFIDDKKDYDRKDIWQARRVVEDLGEEFYLGVLYEDQKRVNFMDSLPNRKGVKTTTVEEVKHYSVKGLY